MLDNKQKSKENQKEKEILESEINGK